MEFGFTEEQEKLRQEVHDFLMNELPEDYNPHLFGPEHQDEELINFKQEIHTSVSSSTTLSIRCRACTGHAFAHIGTLH